IWMAATDGSGTIQLTFTPESESNPKWSPDGKYLAFLSGRFDGKEKDQLWIMNRLGGEARQLTSFKVSISDYEWSPDSKQMVLVIRDQEVRPDSLKDKPAKPIVIERYHFKEDIHGYLEKRYSHLYLLHVESKHLDTLTRGNFSHGEPVWTPDGKHIAFTSNRSQDPDRNMNTDIWLMEARPGSSPKQLTTWIDYDRKPTISPDGKSISYLRSISPQWDVYDEPYLAVISIEGNAPVILTQKLDRPITNPEWDLDGKSMVALVEDDRRRYALQVDLATGNQLPLTSGDRSVTVIKPFGTDKYLVQMAEPNRPSELYILEKGVFRRITKQHDSFLAPLSLSTVEGFEFKNREGIRIGGLLYWPNNKPKGQKLPLILWIHGGPVAQDEFEFDMTMQMLASQGFAVATVNYRGSNGRGYDFARSIFGDWGNKEVIDLLDGVNYLVKAGLADASRLGIGGWSYGGILTDYVTATDSRFKAAASGAGSALQLSMYGTDQYIQQYEMELGVPWKNADKWIKISYPFFKADRINTPTLYMVGQNDFNVPASGSEQMYQALRSRGVPTQLVIYPDQFHGLTVPSYWVDRYTRYIEWFKKFLK
ncbi:MAG: S9 family peptidase, partial [Flammeovirgaceae bacterium]|nr:S9 family peptidase [Flammeovirgaceae bacterium]